MIGISNNLRNDRTTKFDAGAQKIIVVVGFTSEPYFGVTGHNGKTVSSKTILDFVKDIGLYNSL